MTRFTAADRATLAIGLLVIAAGAGIALAGPTEVMPTHFGFDGQADVWSGREVVGLTVGAQGLGVLLIGGAIGGFARRSEDPARARTLRMAQLVVLLGFLGAALFSGGISLAGLTSIAGPAPMAGLSALFLVIGAFIGRVGPNPVAGVRTPWSYKSRLAWDRSNRLAGRLFFLIGLAGLALSPFAPRPLGLEILIGAVLLAAAASVFESWRVWRTDPDRQPF